MRWRKQSVVSRTVASSDIKSMNQSRDEFITIIKKQKTNFNKLNYFRIAKRARSKRNKRRKERKTHFVQTLIEISVSGSKRWRSGKPITITLLCHDNLSYSFSFSFMSIELHESIFQMIDDFVKTHFLT